MNSLQDGLYLIICTAYYQIHQIMFPESQVRSGSSAINSVRSEFRTSDLQTKEEVVWLYKLITMT